MKIEAIMFDDDFCRVVKVVNKPQPILQFKTIDSFYKVFLTKGDANDCDCALEYRLKRIPTRAVINKFYGKHPTFNQLKEFALDFPERANDVRDFINRRFTNGKAKSRQMF